jgi:hypothetical protein
MEAALGAASALDAVEAGSRAVEDDPADTTRWPRRLAQRGGRGGAGRLDHGRQWSAGWRRGWAVTHPPGHHRGQPGDGVAGPGAARGRGGRRLRPGLGFEAKARLTPEAEAMAQTAGRAGRGIGATGCRPSSEPSCRRPSATAPPSTAARRTYLADGNELPATLFEAVKRNTCESAMDAQSPPERHARPHLARGQRNSPIGS